ncbi:MAG: ArsR family transcriptional regulator [Anaeromicrobium sp.]|jgi:SOS-response transcriptional repressor LexA|uniref:LexA family protein n=1 Tax=Anaeromicrobium sp. TaxID=1929132 RepID=UPI0025E3179B|nr:ArsR family transcriptional regulator [Anaeromicrobium sp.]MCT4593213.1 ArsR family transcriptional regulator [Anaeromicrobium sp.]
MLTKKQQIVFDYIRRELDFKGYAPSVREICAAVGLSSPSTVHHHLEVLEKKGFIKRTPTKPRAIEVLNKEFFNGNNIIRAPYTRIDLGILEGDYLTLSCLPPSTGDVIAYMNKDKVHMDIFNDQPNILGIVKNVMRKIS